jgi:hypothetical protein
MQPVEGYEQATVWEKVRRLSSDNAWKYIEGTVSFPIHLSDPGSCSIVTNQSIREYRIIPSVMELEGSLIYP